MPASGVGLQRKFSLPDIKLPLQRKPCPSASQLKEELTLKPSKNSLEVPVTLHRKNRVSSRTPSLTSVGSTRSPSSSRSNLSHNSSCSSLSNCKHSSGSSQSNCKECPLDKTSLPEEVRGPSQNELDKIVKGRIAMLAKLHHMECAEVRLIAESFYKYADKDEHVDPTVFPQFLASALSVDDVDDLPPHVQCQAYLASKSATGEFNMMGFLSWYQLNMFSLAKITASPKHRSSDGLVKRLATEFNMSLSQVYALKSKFDLYDLDKTGEIKACHFEEMLKSMMGISPSAPLPADRLKKFWAEIDRNPCGSLGRIDFEDFAKWYSKYFSDGDSFAAEAFYSSFNPTTLGRKCVRSSKSTSRTAKTSGFLPSMSVA